MVTRRSLLAYSASAATLAAVGTTAGCGAAAFTPAIAAWLPEFGEAIAANVAATGLISGLTAAWKDWLPGVEKAIEAIPSDFRQVDCLVCHDGPPVILMGITKSSGTDPMNDQLLACVNGGKDIVRLEAWAWQALFLYVHDLTKDRKDDELVQMQTLCALSLVPSGIRPTRVTAPAGTIGFVSYRARYGTVEIGWTKNSDGSRVAHVTATGILNKKKQPIARDFALPDRAD